MGLAEGGEVRREKPLKAIGSEFCISPLKISVFPDAPFFNAGIIEMMGGFIRR